MWLIIAIIGAVIYFQFFHQEPKKKKSGARGSVKRQNNQNYKADIPGINWIFQREINEPGVPPIVNTYREKLNGKSFEYIIKMTYLATEKGENRVQNGHMIMQITEPLLELMRLGYLETHEVEGLLSVNYDFLIAHYPTYGLIGQLKNLQDMYNYLKGIPILEKSLLNAFLEIQVRKEMFKLIKKDGFILNEDLSKIESFNEIEFQESLISRLVRSNQIKEEKIGRSITYKFLEK